LPGHGYSETELSELVGPNRTLARRRGANELLTVRQGAAPEADREIGGTGIWRFRQGASLAAQAETQCCGAERRSIPASENGARIVEDMLGRIEHGIYA
jgi:hypothetical protein